MKSAEKKNKQNKTKTNGHSFPFRLTETQTKKILKNKIFAYHQARGSAVAEPSLVSLS